MDMQHEPCSCTFTVEPLRTPFGLAVLSFVERLSSFRGDYYRVCIQEYFQLVQRVLYRRFHCKSVQSIGSHEIAYQAFHNLSKEGGLSWDMPARG